MKPVKWPPIEELRSWVIHSSLQNVATKLGCSRQAVHYKLTRPIFVNNCHSGLKTWELAESVTKIKATGRTGKEIGKLLGISTGYVFNLIRLRTKLIPELWKAYQNGASGLNQNLLLKLSAKSKEEQLAFWKSRNVA